MFVVVTIEITDTTTIDDLRAAGMTTNDVGLMFRKSFEHLMEGILQGDPRQHYTVKVAVGAGPAREVEL